MKQKRTPLITYCLTHYLSLAFLLGVPLLPVLLELAAKSLHEGLLLFLLFRGKLSLGGKDDLLGGGWVYRDLVWGGVEVVMDEL
jgi:hypothetical protein